MTRKEAIVNLNMILTAFIEPVTTHQRKIIDETFEMAIEALSQEPTKEEQALLQKWRDNRGISMEEFEDAMNALQEPCDKCKDGK